MKDGLLREKEKKNIFIEKSFKKENFVWMLEKEISNLKLKIYLKNY